MVLLAEEYGRRAEPTANLACCGEPVGSIIISMIDDPIKIIQVLAEPLNRTLNTIFTNLRNGTHSTPTMTNHYLTTLTTH